MNTNYKFKPLLYYIITFLVTYSLWFAGAYVSFQEDKRDLYLLFMLPGMMAPFLISLMMIFTSKNSELKKDFVNRLFNLRLIQPKLLPVFILIMPLSVLAAAAISLLFGGSTAQIQFAEGFSFSTGFVPVLITLFLAASFEELGWRGYAFDSLQGRYSYLKATIIFSLLWSLWHFPLVFVNNSYQYEIVQENIWFGVNFFVSIIPMGVITSWICIKNRRSVPAAILFHFLVNISQEMLNISQETKCIETLVLIMVAASIIFLDRELFFSGGRVARDVSVLPEHV